MARILIDYPRLPDDASGTYVAQAGVMVITLNSGGVETIKGTFTISGNQIVGGFVTEDVMVVNGLTVFSVTGVQFPTASYIPAHLRGDVATMASFWFGGNDEVFGASGADLLGGADGNDTIIALDGNDTVSGGIGADDVNGNVGMDIVHGDAGNDTVRGGKDNDTIYGDDGDDGHVNGNIGNDLVYGGTGNDTVYGGQDNDTLYGEAGNDVLSGDLGADILYGGAGADRFAIRAGSQLDWAADFNAAEGDRILLAPGTAYTVTAISGQVVVSLGNGDQLGLVGVSAGTFDAGWIVFG